MIFTRLLCNFQQILSLSSQILLSKCDEWWFKVKVNPKVRKTRQSDVFVSFLILSLSLSLHIVQGFKTKVTVLGVLNK
jgi:hypothetical protein